MKKIKKGLSVVLVFALLLTFTAMLPVQSAVISPDESVGGNGNVGLYPGPAYRENTTWYALDYWDEGDFANGTWKAGTWTKDAGGTDMVHFDFIAIYVIFVCMPNSETAPSLEKALFKSAEIYTDGSYSDWNFTVTGFAAGDDTQIVGRWSPGSPDDPEPTAEPTQPHWDPPISVLVYNVNAPNPNGTYHVGEPVKIEVFIKMWINNGNIPNSAVIEISKDGVPVRISAFHYRGVGMTFTDEFTPTEPGTYKVRAGYSINKIDYVNDSNCIGTYNFNVLPADITGDVDGNGIIDVRDVTMIQRHASEYELLTDEQLVRADVDGNGNVTIADATLLQMYLAEYDVQIG